MTVIQEHLAFADSSAAYYPVSTDMFVASDVSAHRREKPRHFQARISNANAPRQRPRASISGSISTSSALDAVVRRVNELLLLEPGWDSYCARPISISAAYNAINWLISSVGNSFPNPSIVPVSDGSIQIEWHTRGIDLEVLFPPHGSPEFSFENSAAGILESGSLPDWRDGELRALVTLLAMD